MLFVLLHTMESKNRVRSEGGERLAAGCADGSSQHGLRAARRGVPRGALSLGVIFVMGLLCSC